MQYKSKIITDILEEIIKLISADKNNMVPAILNNHHRLMYKLINTPLTKHHNNTLLMYCLDTLKNSNNKLEQRNITTIIDLIIKDPRLDLTSINNDQNTVLHMVFDYGIVTTSDHLSKNFCNIAESLLKLLKHPSVLQKTINITNKSDKTFFDYILPNTLLKSNLSSLDYDTMIKNQRYIQRRTTPIFYHIFNLNFKLALQEHLKFYLNEILEKNVNHTPNPIMLHIIKLYNQSNKSIHTHQLPLLEKLERYIKDHATIIKSVLKTTSEEASVIRTSYLLIKKFSGYLNCLDQTYIQTELELGKDIDDKIDIQLNIPKKLTAIHLFFDDV